MALLAMEGFDGFRDSYDVRDAYPTTDPDQGVYRKAGGVTGGGCWGPFADFYNTFNVRVPAPNPSGNDHHIRVGFWCKIDSSDSTSDDYILQIGDSADGDRAVHVDTLFPAGTVSIDLTETFNYNQFSNKSINDRLWHWMEIYARRSDTQEYVELWIDDSLEVSVTKGSGASYTTPFTWVRLTGHTGDMLYDDLIIWNDEGSEFTGKQGPMLIQTDRPNGDGSQSDWTPKTGSDHHLLVSDETVDLMNNNSNLVSKNDGDTDLFTFPDLDPAAISSIKAVEISGASFSNAGPLADVVGVSLIGGVVYEGDENPQANKVSLWKSIFVQNPDTGSDWTVSDLNNAEFGIRTNHA